MSSSTLVETVSINYEDFSDSFLTCGTCLCVYDGVERCPKLLACSHTVCQSCLEHIVEAQVRGNGDTAASVASFRCPICRETITVPRGGVAAFPPSFIVNQLLDLMGRQRRDVVPKCARHSQSELMFCETCDVVFCVDCAGSSHAGSGSGSTTTGGGASAHTVIPFSIAIKRMSEILLYKASLCLKNLDGAAENVAEEMRKLDEAGERCVETAVKAFQDVASAVDRRRDDVIATVRRVRDEKKRVLREQLDIIEAERRRVRADCDGLQSQVDVRNITAKISDLNEKLDVSATLVEPRENAFMAFEFGHNSAASDIASALARFGRVAISKTFPALCTARGPALRQPTAAHLRSTATVVTVDYHGNSRTSGGDPLTAELRSMAGKAGDATFDVDIIDNGDGTYVIGFTPVLTGPHQLSICIFDRPIKDSPFTIEVTDHIGPIARAGGAVTTGGSVPTASVSFKQPVSVAVDPHSGDVYVLDAGNSRIVILDSSLHVKHNIAGSAGLEDRGAVGLALSRQAENAGCNLIIINWRTKSITELSIGENTGSSENPVVVVRRVTSAVLVEPTAVTATSRGEYVVADSAAGGVFVIDGSGSVLASVGSKGTGAGKFNLINAVYCTPTDEIIVCDHRLQVFSRDGRYLYDIGSSGSGSSSSNAPPRGTYGGICRDTSGRYLATRSEKGRSIIQVFGPDRCWLFDVDSHDDRLRRPTGLAVDAGGHVYVADLGNDCVKKFPYV